MGIIPFGKKQRRKIGLALGGGGARGAAHLGAIRALRESGIVFDHVAGVSAGAIAAAAYAVGMPFDEMKEHATNLDRKDILSSKLFFIPSSPKQIEQLLHKILRERDEFFKCTIPLSILAVDIVSGCEHVFGAHSGVPISRAVSASCAVPGVFSPVKHNDMLLMDGGLMNNVPADVLRQAGCDFVVSIHVGDITTPIAKSANVVEVLTSSIKILVRSTSNKGVDHSDIVIVPDLEKYKMTDLSSIETIIEAGYTATMARMADIKELFKA
jgi:NTE family protein